MLSRLRIEGFRSIRSTELAFGRINVLIGANGTGKSNLLSFFRLLGHIRTERLQAYLGTVGSAQSVLFQGARRTPILRFSAEFDAKDGRVVYEVALAHAAQDTLIFTSERVGHAYHGHDLKWVELGAGHKETQLLEAERAGDTTARVVLWNLRRSTWYHFHDTSPEAKVRSKSWIEDHQFLRSDGSNLAAYLYRLRQHEPDAYARITSTIRQIAPDFDDFQLSPSVGSNHLLLNWSEGHLDYLFGPHQMSDGMLRAVGLVTALLQPAATRPQLSVIDEPELGLHPFAINVLAGLIRSAAVYTQFLLSTQSVTFVDQWSADDIVIAEKADHGSTFRRLDSSSLQQWLDEFSVGELWEKNVIGGRPARS